MKITNCRENNLKGISLEIEPGRLTVVTGVSGSGKSTLVYNTICKEFQRLYFSSFSSWNRKFLDVTEKPKFDTISGLDAVIAVDQRASVSGSGSTLGTFSGIYDLLRLIFSRHHGVSRSVFSFNTELGACPACKGNGVEDFLDPELIIADKTKSIRDRALRITAPNGYIIYSQVTLDVLDTVCREHGFSVDTPLCDLTEEQLNVIFYGSDRIKIPFGKHTLESRMKWVGITAKPREEGFYKGVVNVMNEILKRDRNPNILRFVRSLQCSKCLGSRLNDKSASYTFLGKTIYEFSTMTLSELAGFFKENRSSAADFEQEMIDELLKTLDPLIGIGLGSLTSAQPADTLSSSEVQRVKIAAAAMNSLTGAIFIFDEPSIGLTRSELRSVYELIFAIRDRGNTVISIEHDPDAIMLADNIIETGPGGGTEGGELLFSGPLADFLARRTDAVSPTLKALREFRPDETKPQNATKIEAGRINVVTGPSGSGKRAFIREYMQELSKNSIFYEFITDKPIGKTNRSNPATYTGIYDKIRELFAATDEAKAAHFSKSFFSFNEDGGRCSACEGAGVTEIGMKFMGSIQTTCPKCGGKRLCDEVLAIKYHGKSIHDVLTMTVSQAIGFFDGTPAVSDTLRIMERLGIGYLLLGQPSSSLSGGEAQRIKLATHLSKAGSSSAIILDEPSAGLHPADIRRLTEVLKECTSRGITVAAIDNNPCFIALAERVIRLGDEAKQHDLLKKEPFDPAKYESKLAEDIVLEGVETHNLKSVDLHIEPSKFNVITGISGSGKSSIAFDSLFRESLNEICSTFSPYIRTMLLQKNRSVVSRSRNLRAAIGISGKFATGGPRSTVGTVSGLYEQLRMLFSRAGKDKSGDPCRFRAGDFSFSSEVGSCEACSGTGFVSECDLEKLAIDREKSLLDGALDATKQGRFYGDPDGQFTHTLRAVGKARGIDFSKPVKELTPEEFEIAMFGAGDEKFTTNWEYQRGNISGTHSFEGCWQGFANLITDEYLRSIGNKNEAELKALTKETTCRKCSGNRLKKELLEIKFCGLSIAELCDMRIAALQKFLEAPHDLSERDQSVFDRIKLEMLNVTNKINELSIGHLSLSRAFSTLSLGERERLRLVKNSIDSLHNMLFIVDEPSRGLHAAECEKMAELLRKITESGNTVVAVEHVPEIIRKADHVIEVGPGSGNRGGRITFSGSLEDFAKTSSKTAEALNHRPVLKSAELGETITVSGITKNNLFNQSVTLPVGKTTVISGVSGSGKSTLLAVLREKLGGSALFFSEHTSKNLPVTSTIATAFSITDRIKKLFGKGFKIAKTDICTRCKGRGSLQISMDFLGDAESFCPDCGGTGYTAPILEKKLNGKNIAEILDMELNEAENFFKDDKIIKNSLTNLIGCGLSHLKLNRPLSTLSTGELERVRLAKELAGFSQNLEKPAFFIFDEPSCGLHFSDIERFLELTGSLNRAGHTVIIAEHRLQIIASADCIIDLERNDETGAGSVIFDGKPTDLLAVERSLTAKMLKKTVK